MNLKYFTNSLFHYLIITIFHYINNPYFINLFKLYSNLLASQKVLQASIDEISSHINIDKQTYQVKKEELDKELEKVNTKLKKVRTKQFKS